MESGEIATITVAEAVRTLVLLLAPFAPFVTAELWEQIGEGGLLRQPWPVANAELARESEMEIPVQVNGKLVNVVTLAADADQEASLEEKMKAAAIADEKVAARIVGKTVVKAIVVKGRLVNLVVK
jgi:leucyl-tRNA synthetase